MVHISGLQKMTLLDFPGRVACTVFLQGCNFRCPFCHNSGLLGAATEPLLPEEEFFAFLKKRQGLLDGVCITGGEPTLQRELPEFLQKIKALGYAVKLDTNGSNPKMLKALLDAGIVDYVAMDVKNSPARYGETTGLSVPAMEDLEESLRLLLTGSTDYELRTTVVAELHDEASILEMGRWLASLASGNKPKRFFLQSYVDRDSVLVSHLHAPDKAKMLDFAQILAPFTEFVSLRGVD